MDRILYELNVAARFSIFSAVALSVTALVLTFIYY